MAKNEAMLPTSRGTVALVNLVGYPMAQRGGQPPELLTLVAGSARLSSSSLQAWTIDTDLVRFVPFDGQGLQCFIDYGPGPGI